MADSVEIEFQEQNPTIVEVLVNQTVTNIDVTVEAPIAPQVIEVHVDVNSAQVALDAAQAAQAILDQMEDLISGGIPAATSTSRGIVKTDEDSLDPVVYLKATVDYLLSQKLNSADYNDRFKGKHTSFANLQAAHPVAYSGCYATVDPGTGVAAKSYIWDDEEGWVVGSSASPTTTDELTEGATNLFFTAARALAAIPNATNLIAGLSKLYTNLSDSNIDGSVTQAAIVSALTGKQNAPLFLSQVDDFSLLNTTAQQRIFSGGVDNDGAISIVAGTRYFIQADINFIELSASVSKSLNTGFLGTSAASELSIFIFGIITNNTGLAVIQMARMETYGGVLSASSSMASFGRIHMSGILECSASGKLIPTAQFNVSSVGGKTKKGSTFLAIPLGPITSSHN